MVNIAKRILSLCLVVILAMASLAVVADEGRLITVFVDGQKINFDVNPVLDNGRTLVPMRFIFEALGATVGWDDATQTATAVKGDITISITINKPELVKNGRVIVLDVPAKLVNDRTLVPVRAVSEGMDAKVEWIDATSQVIITTASPKDSYSRSELSQNDMAKLVANAKGYISKFEKEILPAAVEGNSNLSAKILAKDNSVLDFVKNLWIETLVSEIKNIQDKSTDSYEYDSLGSTPEEITKNTIAAYVSLAEKSGLGGDGVVKSSEFVDVHGGGVMLSVKYFTPGSEEPSYVGILVSEDGIIKCQFGTDSGSARVYQ